LVTGPLAQRGTGRVCVEVKALHSPDLAHGLAVQLPEYMRAEQTDYGLYVVLDFGPSYQPDRAQFKKYFPEVPQLEGIDGVLVVCAKEIGTFVRCIVLQLYKEEVPSKKNT